MIALLKEPGEFPQLREAGELRCEWEEMLGGTVDVAQIREDVGIIHLRWGRQVGKPLNVRMDIAPLSFENEYPKEQEIGFYGPVLFVGMGPDGPCDIDDNVGLLIMSGAAFGKAVQDAEMDE